METFPAISGAEPCTASARAIPPSPILQLYAKSNQWYDCVNYLSKAQKEKEK